MKRFLILTSDFTPNIGGIAVDTLRLFNLLRKKHEVDLYAYSVSGSDYDSVKYIKKPKFLYPIHLKKTVDSKKYDAILVRTVLPLGWMLNMLKTDAKKVYFVYGQELLHDLTHKPKFRKKVVDIIKSADTVVVNSEYTNTLAGGLGRVFYPLVESCEAFEEKPERESFKIITAGRFVKHKNYFSVLRMIKDIDSDVFAKTGKHVFLEIIGSGVLKSDFEKYIRENGISNIASLHDRVSIESMKESYRSADVAVMPSIKTNESVEGFGMVAQEAGQSGTVTVGYDSGGIKESILDFDLITEENDETTLKSIIIKLLTDREFYREKSRAAFSRSEKFAANERRLVDFENILGF